MKAEFKVDDEVFMQCGLPIDQFHRFVTAALNGMTHPTSGKPVFPDPLVVKLVIHQPDIGKQTTLEPLPANSIPIPASYLLEG